MPDAILQEIRRIRDELAEKYNFDLHAMCEDLRRDRVESTRVVVSPPATPQPESLGRGKTPELEKVSGSSVH